MIRRHSRSLAVNLLSLEEFCCQTKRSVRALLRYVEYRDAQRQMREAVAIKANIDHLLGITNERENKAQER